MSTEFNYVARLDTSQIMSGLSEIRSQVGMALGGAGGFGGSSLSNTNFGGGAAAGMGQMMNALSGGLGTPGRGGTFTDPAMAYSPHYGMQQAHTTLEQEGLIMRGGGGRTGMEWAGRLAPPGVSPGEFAFAAMGNNIDRQIQSREAASMAAQSALGSTAGGLLAGEGAMMLASPLGAIAGGRAATSMFGAGAAGAGKMVGGLAAGLGAMFLASDYVGGKIQDHFADVEQTLGVTRELGDIVGSGRGLNRSQQAELGIATRQAATAIGMDVNQMGDIMALAREGGMLPGTSDPGKFKQQAMDFATAVREASQMLNSSMSDAVELIRTAKQKGMGIEEAAIRAQNVGQGPDYGAMLYGVGAGVARGMGFTGAQGGQLFSGALGQGAGSGISGEERAILGGSMGVAALIGGTQLQAAASPLGTLQLMAARGGQPLGGMMDLPGQAMEAMSQGGDMLSNMGKFMVHQDEYRRGIGSKGVRAMAMHQIESMGDMLSELMPGMSDNEAKRMAAMNMYGMTGTQAEAYVGGVGRRPGGGGDDLKLKQSASLAWGMQTNELAGRVASLPAPEERASFGWGYAAEGAMAGSMIGIKGALIGGVGGLAIGNAKAAWQMGGDIVDGLGHIFDSSTEKAERAYRQSAAAYDRSEAGVKDKMGFFSTGDADSSYRAMRADLSGATLNMTAASPRAMAMTEGALRLSGMTPVAAGPGTVQMGGVSWSLKEWQEHARGAGRSPLKAKEYDAIEQDAYSAFFDPAAKERYAAANKGADIDKVKASIVEDMNTLGAKGADPLSPEYRAAANRVSGSVMSLTSAIQDPKRREQVQKAIRQGGFVGEHTVGRAFVEAGNLGIDMANPAFQLQRGLGSALADTEQAEEDMKVEYLVKAFGPASGDIKDQNTMAREWVRSAGFKKTEDMIRRGVSPKAIQAQLESSYKSLVVRRGGIEDSSKVEGGVNSPGDVGDGRLVVGSYKKQIGVESLAERAINKGAEIMGMVPFFPAAAAENWKREQMAKISRTSADQTQSLESATLGADAKGNLGSARKRTGPAVQSRAIGFGEQEQAMAGINRSLQRTHSMIASLEKRISGGGGTPPVPSAAVVPSGGGASAISWPTFGDGGTSTQHDRIGTKG